MYDLDTHALRTSDNGASNALLAKVLHAVLRCLDLGNLVDVLERDGTRLGRSGSARPLLDRRSLLQQVRHWGSAEGEREGAVRVDGNERRDGEIRLEVRSAGVA